MANPFLRIGFIGSGIFAAHCLRLISSFLIPEWVVTNPPQVAGRGKRSLRHTPVELAALELGLSVHRSADISRDTAFLDRVQADTPDLVLVIDFGQFIREPLLNMAPYGCLNIHPSCLPEYRGSSPVQRAIQDGKDESGVSIFRLVPKMDAGPVLLCAKYAILPGDTSETLFRRAARIGVGAFLGYANRFPLEQWEFAEQDETLVTYAPKIANGEARIDWSHDALEIERTVRAFNPDPVAFTMVGEKRLRVFGVSPVDYSGSPGTFLFADKPIVACGRGALSLETVQAEGKKIQTGVSWWNGSRLEVGTVLSS